MKTYLEAIQTVLSFNNAIDEALQLVSLGVDRNLIMTKLDALIPKTKVVNIATTIQEESLFLSTTLEYISSQAENISADEIRDKRHFYTQVCSSIFKDIGLSENPLLKSTTYNHLLKFREIIAQLPKINIQRYRDMPIHKILKYLKKVRHEDKISARTVNKYIKWLRALFNFAVALSHLQVNLANSIPLLETADAKLQRLPLEHEEFKILLQSVPKKMQYLLKVA